MKFINLTGDDIAYILNQSGLGNDYYRHFARYSNDNILALYYRDFMDLIYDYGYVKEDTIDEKIKILKWAYDNEYTWEHYTMNRLFSIVNRVENVYNENIHDSAIKSPIITGIALYKNYPVGTLIPKKILDYNNYFTWVKNTNASLEEKEIVLKKARYLLKCLMNNDVYPLDLYSGNIKINPDNCNDVRLDGLDNISRVETKSYVKSLKKQRPYGRDLRREVWHNFNKTVDEREEI